MIYPPYSLPSWIDNRRFERETNTQSIKFDITSQINKYNEVKFGMDYTTNRLNLDSYSILDSSRSDQVYTIAIPDIGSFTRTTYEKKPKEFAVYLQDKIEYGDIIVNLGLRYEHFDPNSRVPNNIHEPYIKDPRNPALDSLSIEELENLEWGSISYTDEDTAGNFIDHTYAEFYERFNDQPDLAERKGWWKKLQSSLSLVLGLR